MEKPSKREAAKKTGPDGGGTAPKAGVPHSSIPRSKPKDKSPQSGSAERRYKEMLHTTSHIYQPQVASGLSDTLEEPRVSKQGTQTHTKEVTPVGEERICPTGGDLPEEIRANVPLSEIMSKDQPTSSPVINSARVSGSEGKAKNVVSTERNASEAGSLKEKPAANNVVGHGDQDEHFTNGGTTQCRKHSSAYGPKPLISRPKLCDSCTVSMLSYIDMLRDMLDEVTNEITSQEDQPVQCVECVKERVMHRNQLKTLAHGDHVLQRPHDLPLSKESKKIGTFAAGGPMSPVRDASTSDIQQSYQQATKYNVQLQQRTPNLPTDRHSDSAQTDARTAPTSFGTIQDLRASQQHRQDQPAFSQSENRQGDYDGRTDFVDKTNIPAADSDTKQRGDVFNGVSRQERRSVDGIGQFDPSHVPRKYHGESESRVMDHSETPTYVSSQNSAFFGGTGEVSTSRPAPSDQPSWEQESRGGRGQETSSALAGEDFHSQTSPFLRDHQETDGILSTLSNEEREVYDSARGRAGWERLTDSQECRDTSFGPSSAEEAFVTMATTNAEAISSLVLGSSLLLCRTTRTLCVLVTDGVSPSLRAPLASVFQVVQSVRSLDTVGTTKVALLDQPELGIFFRKLHVWRLVQFSKCVFLNPDTLVIQNSDELFCHEELSAVPDIGWPDCFNSGVFVYQPAVETFWKLVEFAESEGSYDGGDQGLLNAFFKTWSKDIHKKLSFIYNLMANVSYTYTPAFKQFGRNVKIVQFQGAFKPWHVKFYTGTGQIAPSTAVHPTYIQFVHVWLNIFRVRVLPLFSQDIQSFASSRNVISASELLKFFPSPIETEADFLLTPPSVRIRPDPLGTPKQPTILRRHSIGSPKELKRDQQPSVPEGARKEDRPHDEPATDEKPSDTLTPDDSDASKHKDDGVGVSSSSFEEVSPTAEEQPQENCASKIDVSAEGTEDDGSRRSSIPGSEIGDYQGMAAWEQGRMDYMGTASSENILKRLHFLMDKPGDSETPE